MQVDEISITLAGQALRVTGNPDDPYYRNVQALADEMRGLEPWYRTHFPRDAMVIDAGGNIGLTALFFSRLFPDGHVHVFEALPRNAAYLEANLRLNGVTNCTLNAVALGDRPGRVAMQGEGSASHVAGAVRSGPEADGVEVTTLDAYARKAGLDRLDLLKIDVEGFEPAVLAGARDLLDRTRPVLTMEFNSWCLAYIQGYSVPAFAAELWRLFEVTVIDDGANERPAGGGDLSAFLHDNVVRHGAVDDVVLRLRHGATMRDFVVDPPGASSTRLAELDDLRAALDGMHRSTSWRITRPLRALKRLLSG